jgi:hypothetical protein
MIKTAEYRRPGKPKHWAGTLKLTIDQTSRIVRCSRDFRMGDPDAPLAAASQPCVSLPDGSGQPSEIRQRPRRNSSRTDSGEMSFWGTIVLGMLPVTLLSLMYGGRWLLVDMWRESGAVLPDIVVPPVMCPHALDAALPASAAVRALWHSVNNSQVVAHSPADLLAAFASRDLVLLPVLSHQLRLLSNWARFAADLRPPLSFAVLPLDAGSLRAVRAPRGWSLDAHSSRVESDTTAPLLSEAPSDGWMAHAAPVVYVPDEPALGALEDLARVSQASEAVAAAEEARINRLQHLVVEVSRRAAALMQWRAVEGLLAARLPEGDLTLVIGRVDAVLLSNPLSAFSTMPAVSISVCTHAARLLPMPVHAQQLVDSTNVLSSRPVYLFPHRILTCAVHVQCVLSSPCHCLPRAVRSLYPSRRDQEDGIQQQ